MTVRVIAVDALGAPVETYTGTIALSAKGDHTNAEIDWELAFGNGIFVEGGPGTDTATYTFDPADNGVVDLQIRDNCQDFIDPEIEDSEDPSITDDDTEEYIAFTHPNNIDEGAMVVNNVKFGAALTSFASSQTPGWLACVSYVRDDTSGYLTDPTATVVPYKDTSLLGVTPPPNFEMIYEGLPLEVPYPFCNGYNITMPGYPPDHLPLAFAIQQAYFDDDEIDETWDQNVQIHHWNGTEWEIIPATVVTGSNYIYINAKEHVSQLSPFFLTEPEEENIYTASIWIEPERLNTYDTRGWIYGFIEIEGSFGIADIDIGTVTCNPLEIDAELEANATGVAVADPSHAVTGDYDGDDVPDLELRFDRETIVSMFASTNEAEPFMIRGFMTDGHSFFKGTVTIETVDEAVAVTFDLYPETINLKSMGKWVTAYIEMPEYYSVEEIDRSSLHIAAIDDEELADPIHAAKKPSSIGDHDEDGIPDLMVKFDRQELQDRFICEEGIREIAIDGILGDSTAIRGIDNIKVIHSPFEQFAVTRLEIRWDDVTTPDRPHLDAFTVHGSAVLRKLIPIEGLSWDIHFLLSLAGNAAVFEETVDLTGHCGGFLYVYTAPDMNEERLIERLIVCDPVKRLEGTEIPEGLLDNEGTRFVRDILDGEIDPGGRLYVYVRGMMDLAKGWEATASPREARVVFETFTSDQRSLANAVLIGETELKVSTSGGSETWEFKGIKEAEIDERPEPVDSDQGVSEDFEPEENEPVAYRCALFQNHPNPFNPSTTISYELADPSYVLLQIFDVRGSLVRTLVNGHISAGRHEAVWDGLDGDGRNAVSGIYFYSLTAGQFKETRKMVLLK